MKYARVAVLLILIAFPYGPLFPFSPWKPGYQHLALSRADIFWPERTELPEAYRSLDRFIGETEAFVQLKAPRRITVVKTNSWPRFRSLLPHVSTHAIAAITMATGTIVYVSPKLDEKHFDHGEFLLHELGHAVINQNQTIPAAWRFARIEWLAEGIAVANGKQTSYLSREEFIARAQTQPLRDVIDASGPIDMRFAYPAWRYFNEFLMARFGRDRYQTFLLETMREPRTWREYFANRLGGFDQTIDEFQMSVRSR
jgi:hypothetical protein